MLPREPECPSGGVGADQLIVRVIAHSVDEVIEELQLLQESVTRKLTS